MLQIVILEDERDDLIALLSGAPDERLHAN